MTTETSTQLEFAQWLQKEGYDVAFAPDSAREKFASAFSPETFQRFEDLMAIRQERPYTSQELYKVPATLPEAALLLSPSTKLFAAGGQALELQAGPYLERASTVIDYGCGAGSFTRWISQKYPKIHSIGVDRHPGLLEIAQKQSTTHCEYIQADESNAAAHVAKCDILLCHFGIELELSPWQPNRDDLSADGSVLSETTYQTNLAMTPIFKAWREMLKPSAYAFAVLRLSLFDAFVGAVRAAEEAGLPVQLEESFLLNFEGMPIPVLTFSDRKHEPPSLDQLLDWWCSTEEQQSARHFSDASALYRYRSFHRKEVLNQEETEFQDGHFLIKELGVADEWGYIYEYATTGYRRLELVPRESLQVDSDRPVYLHQDDDV